jgi:hypothetical protein
MTRTRNLTVGLVIAGLLGVLDLPSFLMSSDDANDGPPLAVALATTALGLITLVALYFGWRGDRRALWTVAGSRIISALLGVPAFFVDVASGIKIVVAIFIVVTLFAVSLIISELRKVQQPS